MITRAICQVNENKAEIKRKSLFVKGKLDSRLRGNDKREKGVGGEKSIEVTPL
jgi:hypothetical protein